MKKAALVVELAMLMLASAAFAANIGSLAWSQSNIQTLRSLDNAAVARSVNVWGGSEGTPAAMWARDVWEFGWYDLAGDGRYELALITGGRCRTDLILLWQRAPGKIRREAFVGATTLKDTIRDLNGDGTDEIILSKLVVENGGQLKFYWPAVYRLKEGKYVEASRKFPNFYNSEVLPKLDLEISKVKAEVTTRPNNPQDEKAGRANHGAR